MENNLISYLTLGAVLLGAIINIVNLISKHDALVTEDAQKNSKLDTILEKVGCIAGIEKTLELYDKRMYIFEFNQKEMGKTLDELCKEHKENTTPLNLKCGGKVSV